MDIHRGVLHFDVFEKAILEKRKLKISYFKKTTKEFVTRICAPVDFSRGVSPILEKEYYWFFDYSGTKCKHLTKKLPHEIKFMTLLDENFNHIEVCEHKRDWKIKRTNWDY